MKEKISSIAGACFVAAIVAYSLLYALGVAADTRDSLRGSSVSGRENPVSPAPQPAPPPPPPPPSPGGGITNTTSGEAGTGGNSGGSVTTGDENVEVHVVNQGPTNSNNVVTTGGITPPPPSPAAPESTCDPRSRDCVVGGRGR